MQTSMIRSVIDAIARITPENTKANNNFQATSKYLQNLTLIPPTTNTEEPSQVRNSNNSTLTTGGGEEGLGWTTTCQD